VDFFEHEIMEGSMAPVVFAFHLIFFGYKYRIQNTLKQIWNKDTKNRNGFITAVRTYVRTYAYAHPCICTNLQNA
jgi:hypothetical protein